MLQFLNPFWLIALAGLVVPVVIYLWNKKPPRVVRVGSIRWLQAAVNQRARRLAPDNWLLLLLRCVVLVLLALFLAGPVWQKFFKSGQKKLVLVAPGLLQPPYLARVQSTLDSLGRQGYALHLFAPGFSALTPQTWEKIKMGDFQPGAERDPKSYWQLAVALNHRFQRVREQVIITGNEAGYFAGTRPALAAPTRWVLIPAEESPAWVQSAYFTSPDSLAVVVGRGTAEATAFSTRWLPHPPGHGPVHLPDLPGLRMMQKGNQAFLTAPDQKAPLLIQPGPPVIEIYHNQSRREDARYLAAALGALGDYTGRRFVIRYLAGPEEAQKNNSWLFWLTDTPLPPAIRAQAKQGKFIWKDAPGRGEKAAAGNFHFPQLAEQPVLLRRVRLSEAPATAIWQDTSGEPVLVFEPAGRGGVYHFASRLNPQWNDLPQSGLLPELLADLLLPPSPVLTDHRAISTEEVQPRVLARPGSGKNPLLSSQQDLKLWFLALAALFFLTERVLAYRKGGQNA